MSAEEFKAIHHTQTSLGRRRLEAIVTRRQARPRILEASVAPDIFWMLQLGSHSLGPSQPERVFLFKLGPHYLSARGRREP